MLSQGQIETIKGLLAQGTSQRQVHALTGFSRTVISDIAHGRRPDYEAIRRAKAEQSCVSDCPPTRCSHCGYQVYQPCRICAARQRQLIELLCPGSPAVTELLEPLGLDLRPEHYQRYQEVRAWGEFSSDGHEQAT